MSCFKCKGCGAYTSILPGTPVTPCPMCDGELLQISHTATIQFLTFEDGTKELLINTHAFKWERGWEPIGLVDIFKPIGKLKDSVGRIF